ncbi:zinc finger CCCH-type with G patch domain-containing protein-like [Actinia tenebrosa]|uniref:Zinc finger CCCH-type with G patch domain-containing protein n=1 Tax=Actinia tenebrosa TaxID=6105 RepID=A0A6P8HTT8_ACTTE|nr:zinc finger CCCH-type with G patch domain-containing protein-like [Actinia tenebrosa]
MDEESLTGAINEYKEQFLQVQNVLQATGEEGQEDMVKIRDDLVELIHLSEERLLNLKKTRLLQALEEQEASGSKALTFDEDIEDEDDDSMTQNTESVEEEDIIGTKCRVSYTQEWGVKEHHNAMVFSVEMSDDESPDNAKVRVLFLNPTHQSMVPCPYFLDGKCRFSENECRYSHGFLVEVEDLKPFKEPNFSEIKEGQQCLARYSDCVWYKSTIKSVDEDHHEFLVHYDTYNNDTTLGLDSVFPLHKEESPDLSDDEELSSLSSDSEERRFTNGDQDDDNEQALKEWKPKGTNLGDWEQHTRGIGSKLMARMGYIFGKGLGKDGSGRVDPIEAVLLPQGKSLDVCAELREKKKLKEPFKKKRKKKNLSTKSIHVPKQGTINDVFLFLNHKFGGSRGNIQDIRKSTNASEPFDIKDRKRRKGTEDDANVNWNIKLFKIHEEITAAEKQLHKQRQAHGRNATDANTSSFFNKKVKGLEHHITQLKTKEKMIKQKIHQKDQHRKLTVF